MKITPHFTLAEFACRDGTPYPARWVESRLRPLCETLEVIRTNTRMPVQILSGYRTDAYNRKIGGARRSQHVEGRAADIRVVGATPATVQALVLQLAMEGRLVHLGGLGSYPTFTHVDVRPGTRLARWEGTRRSNVA